MPDAAVQPAAVSPPIARARKTPGIGLTDSREQVDMRRLRAYRLGRLRAQLKARDYAGAVLYDPINIRYATGSSNMSVWTLHNAARYAFVATDGPVVLFDFHNCEHLAAGLETIAEVRPAISWYFFGAGPRAGERVERWAMEIADLVAAHGGGNRRLALDHCDPLGAATLARHGIDVFDAQEPAELARCIKSPDELTCISAAISVCETGMARMRARLEAGISENELWSHLHQANIALGGEWIETRLLASGGRTNPWFQECSDRIIRAGELVSFDTDLIGPFGYCADLSRTFFCGPGRPTDEQRRLYGLAYEQIHFNLGLLKLGLGFRELTEKAWRIPERFVPNRYSGIVHGVGMADEFPHCSHTQDYAKAGYDGVFEPGMTICVESYIGEVGGDEGVKLEQQVAFTESGIELLSTFPFEQELLPARWL